MTKLLKNIQIKKDDNKTWEKFSIINTESSIEIDDEKSSLKLETSDENFKDTIHLRIMDNNNAIQLEKKLSLSDIELEGTTATLSINKGTKDELPSDLKEGELYLATDKQKLFTKIGEDNVCLSNSPYIAESITSLDDLTSQGLYLYVGQLGTLEEYTDNTWMIKCFKVGTSYLYEAVSITDPSISLRSLDKSSWVYPKTGWYS